MEKELIELYGINREHASMIDKMPEPQRSRKLEELREWRITKKIDWSNNV